MELDGPCSRPGHPTSFRKGTAGLVQQPPWVPGAGCPLLALAWEEAFWGLPFPCAPSQLPARAWMLPSPLQLPTTFPQTAPKERDFFAHLGHPTPTPCSQPLPAPLCLHPPTQPPTQPCACLPRGRLRLSPINQSINPSVFLLAAPGSGLVSLSSHRMMEGERSFRRKVTCSVGGRGQGVARENGPVNGGVCSGGVLCLELWPPSPTIGRRRDRTSAWFSLASVHFESELSGEPQLSSLSMHAPPKDSTLAVG